MSGKNPEKKTLGPLLTLKKGKKPKTQSPVKEKGMQPYVDIKAFETGVIDNYTDDDKCLPCNDGDLLIVCDGSRSGYIGRAIKGYTGSTLAKISAEGVDNSYLYYFIQSMYKLLNTQMKGTGTPHLNVDVLRKAELVIPSLKEQKRIVNEIEELFSELDSAVETLKKTKEQLVVYRQSVLKEAFEACLQSETLKDVCSCITDGDHMPPPKASSGIPFVMISDVKNNTIQWDDTAFVKRDYFEKLDKKRVPQKGDVLYTVTGSFGIPIIVDYEKEFCFQRHIALLRPDLTKIEQKYLFYVMQSPQIFQQASDVATGTAQKTVGLTVLRTINIPYDNIQQQRKIVNHIESRLSACENIEKTVNEALMQADAMRQSILKKAFEGSL